MGDRQLARSQEKPMSPHAGAQGTADRARLDSAVNHFLHETCGDHFAALAGWERLPAVMLIYFS
jgi:hypothetical protein